MSIEKIRTDFDRLALLDGDEWNHNNQYHPFLLGFIPQPCETALEIGCGTGAFSHLLARRSAHVLGLDLAPEMVRLACERSQNTPNIEYRVADVLAMEFPPEAFDCIASIATFHHLPMPEILAKAKNALKPGGVLLLLDLFQSEWPGDFLTDVFSAATSPLLRLMKTGRLRESAEVRAAWQEHGKTDRYLTLNQVREICQRVIPNATVQRHLFWRYSVVWKKPL